jgi:hypothetical protein
MQTAIRFQAEADFFRFRAARIAAVQPRALILHFAQTWETLAAAWDQLPPHPPDTPAD